MINWGAKLVAATWQNSIADFPSLSVGVTYLPIPSAAPSCCCSCSSGWPSARPPGWTRRRRIRIAARARRADGHLRPPRDDVHMLRHRHADRLLACAWRRSPALSGSDIPLEAVMLKISDGVSKVAMLTIPFFVLAGAIMAEGGMAQAACRFRRRAGRLHARARRPLGRQRRGDDFSQRHFRFGRRRHIGDRLGHDSANGDAAAFRASSPPM